jgi:hypothetical protein
VVSWQLAEDRLSLHEPVFLGLKVDNTTDTAAILDLGPNFTAGLIVRVTDANGKPVGRSVIPPRDGLARLGVVRVEPRSVFVRDFVVNAWAAFTEAGRYSIAVTFKNPILLGALSVPPPPETFLALLVEERDEGRLRKKCEDLLTRITAPEIDAASIEDARLAMEALTHVPHAFSVEYLVRATTAPIDIVSSRALAELAEIGTPAAINAISEVAQRTGSLAVEAQRHLARIEALSRDPLLRERVRRAKEAAQADPKN